MVQYDSLHAAVQKLIDWAVSVDAVVDRDDQGDAAFHNRLDERCLQPIAVAESVGDEDMHAVCPVRPALAHRFMEDGGATEAVDIVVSQQKDLLVSFHGVCDAQGSPFDVQQSFCCMQWMVLVD